MDGNIMRKIMRTCLITISILIVCGFIVMAVFHTEMYDTNAHIVDCGFTSISIQTDTADVSLLLSEDGKCTVDCYESEKVKHSVTTLGDTLSINVVDERKWYERIGIFMGSPKVTVYLPAGAYDGLVICEDTGDIEISNNFCFDSMDISTTTGNISNYASANKTVNLKATTGSIDVKGVTAESLCLSVSTGKMTVTDVKCKNLTSHGDTGDLLLKNVVAEEKISVERDTGDVKLDRCDAAEIFVETDTGDVTGSLLSEKVFVTETDTGSIKVPKTTTGGKCEINTDTGDIKISID